MSTRQAPLLRVRRAIRSHLGDVVSVESSGRVIPLRAFEQTALVIACTPCELRWERRAPVPLAAGAVVLLPSRLLHGFAPCLTAPLDVCRVRVLLLGPDVLAHVPGGVDAEQAIVVPGPARDDATGTAFADLIEELDRPLVDLARLDNLVAAVTRLAARRPSSLLAWSGRLTTPLTPVRDHLRAHVGAGLSLTALERLSGLNRYHLVHRFTREFLLPPRAYHVRLRLARAWSLLGAGRSVTDATFITGFADQSHLSRTFKAIYGLPPARFARGASDAARSTPEPSRPAAAERIARAV